jgi:hypothetical protein
MFLLERVLITVTDQIPDRYRYVDVAICSVIRELLEKNPNQRIVISYDINCKWSVNFLQRVKEGDPALLPVGGSNIHFVVPKFHIEGHEKSCADKYSLDYNWGVGRMSGELVETLWAKFNATQYSIRYMTPGHRRDTINDHSNSWNHEKRIRIGMLAISGGDRVQANHSFHRSTFQCQPPPKVTRIEGEYRQAIVQTAFAAARVKEIEDSLGEVRAAEIREASRLKDGSQFRPNPEKMKCA